MHMEKEVGVVTHYYNKAGVAVVKLSDSLSAGDRVKFKRGEEDLFEQEVSSMQIDYKPIESAKKGQEVAVKVDGAAKEGVRLYAVE